MKDTENLFDGFALLGDDEEFDVDKIFGSSSDEPAPPPPAPTLAEEVKPQPEPEQPLPAKTQEVPAEEKQPLELFSAFTSAESDPIPEAAPVKSIAPRSQTQLSLFDKPPVFQYGGAREQITDADMTFESLRIQKADDFPELEDASAVTWQVRYGDITKTVPAPKTDTIAAMKAALRGGLKNWRAILLNVLVSAIAAMAVRAMIRATTMHRSFFMSLSSIPFFA